MLGLNGSLRVFLAVEPVDLRKSFNGLHGVVLDRLKEDPCSGRCMYLRIGDGTGSKRSIGMVRACG